MDEIERLTKEIKKCPLDQSDRIPNLIGELKNLRGTWSGSGFVDRLIKPQEGILKKRPSPWLTVD